MFKEIGAPFCFYTKDVFLRDLRLGAPLVLAFLVDFILATSDRYFIASYLSVKEVGYYSPGYALGSMIVLVPKAMCTVIPQLLSRAVDENNQQEAQTMLSYVSRAFLLLGIPFIFGSLALGKPVLTLLANKDVAENACYVVPLVATGTLFYGLTLILSTALFVRMKTSALFKMNCIAALFNLVANAVLLAIFKSILIAGITTLMSYFIAFSYITLITAKEGWRINITYIVVIKAVMAGSIMYAVLLLIQTVICQDGSIYQIVYNILLGIVVYIFILFAFRVVCIRDINMIKISLLK